MDGFYVCKIQKLSDNFKTEEKSSEVDGLEQEVGAEEIVDAKHNKSPLKSNAAASGKKKGGKKRHMKSQAESATKKVKSEKLSIPPTPANKTQGKDKKKTLGAKMTKPRRQNRETMT
jgi:hypothetical protein